MAVMKCDTVALLGAGSWRSARSRLHPTVVRGTGQESNLICFSDTKYPETSFFSYEASVS